jgi:hypothetical protein
MSRDFVWRYARRLNFESLESRRVLATFTVTNLSDAVVVAPGNAPGTLRQAIYDANHTLGADTIEFAANLSGSVNLSVVDDTAFGASALVISSPITIAGNSSGVTIGRNAAAAEMRLFRVTSTGDLTLHSLSVTGGIARGANASVADGEGGDGLGGAIYNAGLLQIVSSTLYGNQAIGGSGGQPSGSNGSGRGGAIYSDNAIVITNSTLSGNSAGVELGHSFGGATYSKNGSVLIRNSTITNNTATSSRGVYVLVDSAATIDIRSSILGQGDVPVTVRDLLIAPANETAQITVTGSNNLMRFQSDYPYITVSTDDPMLGPLANNGGPTMTHAITFESPAVNLGSNSQSLQRDQRGGAYSREVGGAVDIGAFELQTVVVPPLPTDYNRNSVVDAADYVVWRKTFGQPVLAYSGGDGTGDGAVDQSDFNAWRSTFGATAPGAAAVASSAIVVEPSGRASSGTKTYAVEIAAAPKQANLLFAVTGKGRDVVDYAESSITNRSSSGDHDATTENIVDAISVDAAFAVWRSA